MSHGPSNSFRRLCSNEGSARRVHGIQVFGKFSTNTSSLQSWWPIYQNTWWVEVLENTNWYELYPEFMCKQFLPCTVQTNAVYKVSILGYFQVSSLQNHQLRHDFFQRVHFAMDCKLLCFVLEYLSYGTCLDIACFQIHSHYLPKTCLKSVPWTLAEFYFNTGLQRLYTGTCTILQKTINGFLCQLIVFLKSKTHQLKFEGRDQIEYKLTVTNGDKIVAGWHK